MPSSSPIASPNISTFQRYVRLTTGIMALCSAGQLGRSQRFARSIITSFGAMKVAEGVTGFCPLTAACDLLSQSRSATPSDDQQKQTQTRATQAQPAQESAAKQEPKKVTTANASHSADHEVRSHGDQSVPTH